MSLNSQGYILVEMLVAIAVTSIVLNGTYAAYTFFPLNSKPFYPRRILIVMP
ncbi:prepilin-type N-terminal cleavage/methylation domain-containing protein [Polynucleobacter necessarius]|uniref:prepilin-type N-terminal cleavage/methylation domain-containing protein n=1 Tax=Polynucleobacter necessarius TaxID=576610 RepID=UPI000E09CD4D|nr:prepilin-type N-terminal cleavage/methylation domain-containing protein [Polynucleobacter necessarius]